MGTVLRFAAATLVIPLSIGSIAWSTTSATASTSKPAVAIELAQTYNPPNNGGPNGTTGSGIR